MTVPESVLALIDERLVFPDLAARTRDTVLAEMARRLVEAGVVRDAATLAERLRQRERDGCTGLGGGIAIPHVRMREISDVILAVGVSKEGIDFGAGDGRPVTAVFLLLSPMDAPAAHLQALARVSKLARTPGLVEGLRRSSSSEEIRNALAEAEAPLGRAAI